MTTDRELLELAAIAIGEKIRFSSEGNKAGEAVNYREYIICEKRWEDSPTHYGYSKWNPLEDDGDALRLAVRLGIDQQYCSGAKSVEVWSVGILPVKEKYGADKYAATRRAIVRAAAEIGKAT